MALASQLPVDILFRISAFITVDADKSLGHWKHGLSLLAVCSHWRATIVPLVFKSLSVEVITHNEADRRGYAYKYAEETLIVAFSNYQLAKHNGHLCWARHLHVCDLDDDFCVSSMALVADALEMDEDDVPGIVYLRYWYNADISAGKHSTNWKTRNKACRAAREMARLLRQRLPDITSLTVQLDYKIPCFIEFGDELMHAYIGQLAQLDSKSWSHSEPPISPSLRKLAVRAKCFAASNQHIDPQNVKSLELTLDNESFSWNFFRESDAASSLVFDRLKNLVLIHDNSTPMAYESIDVSFRVLQRLHINHTVLPAEFYQTIFNSAIRTLIYEGTLANAQNIFTYNVGVLDTLDLQLAFFGDNEAFELSCAMTNQMFKCTKGIRAVCCALQYLREFDLGLLNWQHVTHVSLWVSEDVDSVFKFVVSTPCLIDVKLIFSPRTPSMIFNQNALLSTIKSVYLQPVNSNVARLNILHRHDVVPYSEEAVANIYWLFPKLKCFSAFKEVNNSISSVLLD